MSWTSEDEANLVDLQERKKKEYDVLTACVWRLVDRTISSFGSTQVVTDDLIAHATEFRKVLEPFESEFK